MAALYSALASAARELPYLSDYDRAVLLRDAVCAAVDELGTNRTSERVVFLIKQLAAEAGIEEPRDQDVVGQLTAWCVQRYYGSRPRRSSPSDDDLRPGG